ncbi:DUF6761 family protein [Synechococcus sp. PCC 7336]|uniref:DUF6761 family protein n=1 Tax=Synechococcus sp. PCC 7336 TaxID=195250 RepID=UPI00036F2634|nr:DUF6761 family protein [Synechococcus sp. PCC 7336]
MLQDYRLIRHYQSITDSMVDLWQRGYRMDDLRLVMDGYLMALRTLAVFEGFEMRRLEEEVIRFLHDPASFELPLPETEVMPRY